jgi:hypothetical protein
LCGVAQCLVFEHHRYRIGSARNLRRKQRQKSGRGDRPRGVVPFAQYGVALCSGQNIERPDHAIRIGDHRIE